MCVSLSLDDILFNFLLKRCLLLSRAVWGFLWQCLWWLLHLTVCFGSEVLFVKLQTKTLKEMFGKRNVSKLLGWLHIRMRSYVGKLVVGVLFLKGIQSWVFISEIYRAWRTHSSTSCWDFKKLDWINASALTPMLSSSTFLGSWGVIKVNLNWFCSAHS